MAEPMGFYTDTTVCIGCKACEVACKEWNQLPSTNGGVNTLSGDSYDNTRRLDGIHWRHVKFIEQFPEDRKDGRWLLMSDVCKHCVQAACLEVCPTGAIIRTEFDTVVIQSNTCNGCRDCIAACPFGVIDINPGLGHGAEVHALLRPPAGRPGAGLLQGVPDQVDPVRNDPRASGDARGSASSSCTRTARAARISTAPTRRCSAGSIRSICWSTSRKSTGCRPTRRCRPATWCRLRCMPSLGAILVGLAGIFNFRNRGAGEGGEVRP